MWKIQGNNYENIGGFFILINELQSVIGIHFVTELKEVENPEKSNANGKLFFFLTWKNKDKLALGQEEEIRGISFHCMAGHDHSWTLIACSLSLEV